MQTLADLGLTVLQARVYIALTKTGTSTGRATAKMAKVASQDVYRVLSELQEKGFVEKIIAKPNRYKPIPIEEGLSMLLERRDQQTMALERECEEISRAIKGMAGKKEVRGEIGDFILIPQKEPIENNFVKMWHTSKVSVDMINYFQEGIVGHERKFELEVEALDRGVKIRDILYRSETPYRLPASVLALQKRKPQFSLRLTQRPPPAIIVVKDNREVFISTMTRVHTLAQPYLWSNNLNLVRLTKQWYNMLWEKATELFESVSQSTTILL